MAQLIVRNIEDGLKSQLAMLAKKNGHSMEEEVRQMIKTALTNRKQGLGTKTYERFRDLKIDFKIPELKSQRINNPFEGM